MEEELRPAAPLRQEPEASRVRQPARLVETPVDPGRIVQSVHRSDRAVLRLDHHEPAVLVVVRTQLNERPRAVGSPGHRAHAHRPRLAQLGPRLPLRLLAPGAALLLAAVLARLLGRAQLSQGIVAPAGQVIQADLDARPGGEVEQDQPVGGALTRADLGADLALAEVAVLGDPHGHQVAPALFAFLLGDRDQQVAAGGGERGAAALVLVPQEPRRRRARGIGGTPLALSETPVVARVATVLELTEQAPVLLREEVLVLRGAGLRLEEQLGEFLLEAGAQVAGEDPPAPLVGEPAVDQPLW